MRVYLGIALFAVVVAGCQKTDVATEKIEPTQRSSEGNDEVGAERAKLTPEDRVLVEAQEWCVVQNDERLGSMGPPLKLDVKGKAVFVCCKGCKKKAEADADRTLAKLAELKAKAATLKAAKK